MNWDDFDTVLFDLDGVLTPTADVHMRAWEQMFSEFLRTHGVSKPYEDHDYFAYIDGKPRYEGVRSMLESRGISLPDGSPQDDPSSETICGLGNRKNDAFAAVLRDEGVQPYPGSVALLETLAARGTKVAVVSSSRNAPAVLAAAGLADRFTVVVDGMVAADKGLPGKPSPDTFVHAAEQLGTPVERAVVVEDAISGVQAAHSGGFGMVIGVDRGVGAQKLRDAGADLVVSDLAELVEQ
ncbi:MAG TPA: beta-phosphoglucomutase family hydrolase [Propionibacteriaceae bacterium]|nr:beta-phosphoglucomutase family hydrolase [Propionibacteriaceae bacterium]